MTRGYSVGTIIAAFGVGLALGAASVALFTPNTGRGMRKRLLKQGMKIRDFAVDGVQNTGKRSGEFVGHISQQVRDSAESLLHRGKVAAEEFKSNVEEEAKSKAAQMR